MWLVRGRLPKHDDLLFLDALAAFIQDQLQGDFLIKNKMRGKHFKREWQINSQKINTLLSEWTRLLVEVLEYYFIKVHIQNWLQWIVFLIIFNLKFVLRFDLLDQHKTKSAQNKVIIFGATSR